ncbi:glycoside hydrolase family 27 protein [Synoicihabitans lomoniglobus]|uniref:Alpha-galactosidase n=1 Tax=Synoicihabitans lomoniglobus TaxID=2909285 RepID=A0AAE9ZTH7_9BACT|nr:glycoside hydrolase family 27 protein [Opitutaceae bacterium LMO-M01]WED63026.1 glycoside hydrolase family 27 protein [Opitutaceae bacterium LMO-M01]
MKTSLLILGAAILAPSVPAQKFEHLAQTPPMGWNSWNTFSSHISEDLVKGVADAMIANGMRDAGYEYIVLDDTWSLRERDADGNLVADPEKFPSGMKALADYVHERGFKLGIYGDAGSKTCAGYPGSQGHEYQDARTWASWGIDYLKYDWCSTGTRDAREAYTTMRDALYTAKRPVVFSMCEWGRSRPWEWAQDVGHLWRTSGDIYDSWDGYKMWEMGWKRILDLQTSLVDDWGPNGIAKYAGPGHWNDPDMMEVGNEGLSVAESRAHFSLWAMLAAPLMAGNDVRHMSDEIIAIMTDADVIAINQDPAGKQGFRALAEDQAGIEVFIKELSEGEWAVCALNTSDETRELTIPFHRFYMLGETKELFDVWSNQVVGDTSESYTRAVDSHDVMMFRLRVPAAM